MNFCGFKLLFSLIKLLELLLKNFSRNFMRNDNFIGFFGIGNEKEKVFGFNIWMVGFISVGM